MKKSAITLFLLVSIIKITNSQSYKNSESINDTIISSDIQRTYSLQLPTEYNEDKDIPLILVLHGYHTENLGMPQYSGFDRFVDRDVIVVYPHGLIEENGNNYFWNSGGGHIINYGGIDDVGFISNLIDTLSHEYAINTDSVFIVGHSNGGMMSYRLAMEISHKITAMANLAGSMMFDTIVPDQPVPILHIHGTSDPTVRLTGSTDAYWPFLPITDVLYQWADWNNCEPEPDTLANTDTYQYLKWSDIDGENQVLAAYIKNQGHDWAAITNSGWNIAENMWSFFTTGYLLSHTTDIKDISTANEMKIYYQNKTRSIHVSHPEKAILQIRIFDLSGKITLSQTNPLNNLDVNNLNNGIYILFIKLDNEIISKKICIY